MHLLIKSVECPELVEGQAKPSKVAKALAGKPIPVKYSKIIITLIYNYNGIRGCNYLISEDEKYYKCFCVGDSSL